MRIKIFRNKYKKDYSSWNIWECKPSQFDWEYIDEERCYIIEGEAIITESGNTVKIQKGDYVVFPKGLKCKWNIVKSITKFYCFK